MPTISPRARRSACCAAAPRSRRPRARVERLGIVARVIALPGDGAEREALRRNQVAAAQLGGVEMSARAAVSISRSM